MSEGPLGALGGLADKLASPLLSAVTSELARRGAGDIAVSSPATIDQDFDEAIAMLMGEADTLPKQVVIWVKSRISEPPAQFHDPEAKDWLRRDDVRALLKRATLDLITIGTIDNHIEEAKELYATSSGEAGWYGEPLFIYAVSFIGLSLKAKASDDARLLLVAGNHRAERTAEKIAEIHELVRAGNAEKDFTIAAPSGWSEVEFVSDRGLSAALTGQMLGPADVSACPRLIEANTLLHQLEQANVARLAGAPGAGKSICMLQTARSLADKGWRVLRLDDPAAKLPAIEESDQPTLYLIDNAHLISASQINRLEEGCGPDRRLLSVHTTGEVKTTAPGTIHLDAKRAVRTIAAGFQADFARTFEAVRQLDDRVGNRMFDEPLEHRLELAARAQLPWQFCFILSGGWRRAASEAASARAVGADLILAALAARQIAARDASCSMDEAMALLGPLGSADEIKAAIAWLLERRLLLEPTDLRCPHQRFGSVLIREVLNGQDKAGRVAIAGMLRDILRNPAFPLSGLATLLSEISSGAQYRGWARIIEPEWLDTAIEQLWAARTPGEIHEAAWFALQLRSYRTDEMDIFRANADIIGAWIAQAPPQACYAVGDLVNHIFNTDEPFGAEIRDGIEPDAIAQHIFPGDHRRAHEILSMTKSIRGTWDAGWSARFMAGLDRDAVRSLIQTWPHDLGLSYAQSICEALTYMEEDFGLDLIEELAPAVAPIIERDPLESFHEIHDLFSFTLRVLDILRLFVGKNGPDARRKALARKYAKLFARAPLAAKISACERRDFQNCAMLLSFLQRANPAAYHDVIRQLDWEKIDATIGEDWRVGSGDGEVFLGMAFGDKVARPAIKAVIERNLDKIDRMPSRLALMFPDLAIKHLDAGRRIGFDSRWPIVAVLIVHFGAVRPDLLDQFISPEIEQLAADLSQPSPSFMNERLFFYRVLAAAAPDRLSDVLAQIDVEKARIGWTNALTGKQNTKERGKKREARQVAAFIIEQSIGRDDACGELARVLRKRYPAASIPNAKTIEPLPPFVPMKH
ncbi:MAG TPA: hypothetical protein VN034_07020 [Sphingopyxis sp.]|nr:hypothetical protein [Sphingopyxis sp.]